MITNQEDKPPEITLADFRTELTEIKKKVGGDVTLSPRMVYQKVCETLQTSQEEVFTEIYARATKIVLECDFVDGDDIDNIRKKLKETYQTAKTTTKGSIAKLHQILHEPEDGALLIIDDNMDIIRCLQEGKLDREDITVLMAKILMDERSAYLNSLPILAQAAESLEKINSYLENNGIPLRTRSFETIVFCNELSRVISAETGEIKQYAAAAVSKKRGIDPENPSFVLVGQPDIDKETNQRNAAHITGTMLHEELHLQNAQYENIPGSNLEIINELLTEFFVLETVTKALEKTEDSYVIMRDYCRYYTLIRASEQLIKNGAITTEELLELGLTQNPTAFIERVTETIAHLEVETRIKLIHDLEDRYVIGHNHSEKLQLQAQECGFTMEDILDAIKALEQEVGTLKYHHGAMLVRELKYFYDDQGFRNTVEDFGEFKQWFYRSPDIKREETIKKRRQLFDYAMQQKTIDNPTKNK